MVVSIGNVSFTVESGRNDWFWKRVNSGNWEPETFRIFEQYVGPDTSVFDIGAWVGATVLYNAHRARRVIAYEPDPVAFQELQRNVQLNPRLSNVSLNNAAVTFEAGPVKLGVRGSAGDSESSLLLNSDDGWEVPGVPLEAIAADVDGPLFFKIDVEGHEFSLARSISSVVRDSKAVVFLALHPHLFGIARAARVGRRTPLRKLTGSVLKRTAGRVDALAAVRKFWRDITSNAILTDTDGRELDYTSTLLRVLLGKNVTDTGSVIVRPR